MKEAKTLNELLLINSKTKEYEAAIRAKDRQKLFLILKDIGFENPSLDDVDFMIKHTRLDSPDLKTRIISYLNKFWYWLVSHVARVMS